MYGIAIGMYHTVMWYSTSIVMWQLYTHHSVLYYDTYILTPLQTPISSKHIEQGIKWLLEHVVKKRWQGKFLS